MKNACQCSLRRKIFDELHKANRTFKVVLLLFYQCHTPTCLCTLPNNIEDTYVRLLEKTKLLQLSTSPKLSPRILRGKCLKLSRRLFSILNNGDVFSFITKHFASIQNKGLKQWRELDADSALRTQFLSATEFAPTQHVTYVLKIW